MSLAESFTAGAQAGTRDPLRWICRPIDLGDVPPGLALLARHWFEKRTGGHVPARSAIEPSALKSILPNISILGFERSGNLVHTIRVRLWGTGLIRVYGQDWTGSGSQDFHNETQNNELLARMREIADRRMPLLWRQRSLVKGCEDLYAERMFCPLTNGTDRIESVIAVLEFSGNSVDPRVRDGFGPLLLGQSGLGRSRQ